MRLRILLLAALALLVQTLGAQESSYRPRPGLGVVKDQGGQVYNVKAFGLVGDGVTDDGAKLDTLCTTVSAAGGGVIYFPPGTYAIGRAASAINLSRSNITFRGSGLDTTVLKRITYNAAMFYSSVPAATPASNIAFENLTFDGNYPTLSGVSVGLVSVGSNVSRVTFDNCRFINASYSALSILCTHGVTVQNCIFEDAGTAQSKAIDLQQGGYDYRFVGNKFRYLYGGINESDSENYRNIEISGNSFDGGCWYLPAQTTGTSTGMSATVLTDSGANFNLPATRRNELNGTNTTTTSLVSSGATTIPVVSTTGFAASGTIIINGLLIHYSALTSTSFTVTGADVSSDIASGSGVYTSILAGQIVRVMSTRVTGTGGNVTYTSGASPRVGIKDTGATFISSGVLIGDIVRAGSAFGVVSNIPSETAVSVEEWLSNTTRYPVGAPAAGTTYTIYNTLYGHITTYTATTLTVSRFTDLNGNGSTPAANSYYELSNTLPNYQGVYFSLNSANVRIENNRIARSSSDAIAINAGISDVISGNDLYFNHDTAITVQANRCAITGNRIHHTGSNGIAALGSDNNVSGNIISATHWLIGTDGGADIQVGNLGGSQSPARNKVIGNTLLGDSIASSFYGVLVDAHSGAGTATNNEVSSNISSGHATADYKITGSLNSGTIVENNTGTLQNPDAVGTMIRGTQARFAQSDPSAPANTNTTGAQALNSVVLPATGIMNTAGRNFRFRASGRDVVNNSSFVTYTLKLNGVTIASWGSNTLTVSATAGHWAVGGDITIVTPGASGAVACHGNGWQQLNPAAATMTSYADSNGATVTGIDLTGTTTLAMFVTYSANGSTPNTCTQDQFSMEPTN